MFEPYPSSEPAPEPPPIQLPSSVQNAVKLMYAGAALEVILVIVAIATASSLKSPDPC